MFRNNLKLVFRRLRKERIFTLVNVVGLTIGLTAFLMISLYIRHELSFDRFHKDYENIYRVTSQYQDRDWKGVIPSDYVEFFEDDIVGLDSYSRLRLNRGVVLVEAGGKELNTDGVLSADKNFFEFFSFELIDGLPSSVLSNSGNAVLTEDLKEKLFGNGNAIGEELLVEKGNKVYTITGIAKKPPLNSTVSFKMVTFDEGQYKNNFAKTSGLTNVITYLKLTPDFSKDQVVEAISDARSKPPYKIAVENEQFDISSMADQRLYADYQAIYFEQNDIRYLKLFGGIALVVLLLAIINYVNLVTAQATKKVKEIGLRKVIGAGRYQLMFYQFLESIVVVVFSFMLAFALTERLLIRFNEILNKDIALPYFGSTYAMWVLIAGVIIGGLSGIYPAVQILKVSPISTVKSTSGRGKQSSRFRKVLVLFQFTVTALLLSCLMVMMNQMNYLKSKDLGFDASAVLSIPLDQDSTQAYQPLKQEFLKIPGVRKASIGGFQPGGSASIPAMNRPNIQGKEAELVGREAIIADAGFLDVMEMQVHWQARDNAIRDFGSGQVIINKTMAASIGALEQPEGKRIYGWSDQVGKEIVAIVEDFHMKSLKDEIEPMTIYYLNSWGTDKIFLKLEANSLSSTIPMLAEQYEAYFGRPFEYDFLDDQIAAFYQKEQGQFRLFQIFSSIAISISLLGLIALTVYSLEQRRKEVSIRKVLGASMNRLILMLNKEYSILIGVAFILAVPVAYFAMQNWLNEFQYRISLSPLIFIGAFMSFLALSWLVTLGQSLKVSKENPADVLRDE